ncbi:2-C-methyl-D-erythritol 4-phosphate cytidylyltransferase [Marivita sp. S0852]|uniref:2-C-methyl-D-erythritol 4-phosphate cytidylyltransferase n=1 Tax=Marivita sp. S0852 TaxID=3373893 RepID=UPI003982B4FC
MTNAVLIVAAGRGSRMMRETPKQYLKLGERAVLDHTIHAFLALDRIDSVQVVIHPDDAHLYTAATSAITDSRLMPPVTGGASRAASVRLGLEALQDAPPTHVLIHDAARPQCSADLILRVIDALAQTDGAFAALPVVDALWQTDGFFATTPVPRDGLWRAQTPQGFRYDAILDAHRTVHTEAADDVEIARLAGLTVQVVEGEEDNFKITLPRDLARAEQGLKRRQL